MTPERYQEFVERIMAESGTINTHYMENPELSHFSRLANAMSAVIGVAYCGAMRKHWNCIVGVGGLTQALYALMVIKPVVLDEIYAEFKPDFQELIPEGFLIYPVLEYRGYPVPEELAEPQGSPEEPA